MARTLNLDTLQHPSSTVANLTLNDDGSTVITPSVQTTARNKIINGSFAVDQRNAGGSQTVTAGAALAYTADRWYAYCTGANVTGQRIAGSAPFQYYYRFTGAASNTAVGFGTRLEAADTFHLAGTTATLSAYLASSSITTVTWTAYYANTTDTFGTLASPTRTQIATGTFTINSTLARKSVQISVPSAATTGIEIVFTTGALLGSQTLTFAGVQFESGPVATPFEFEPYETTLRKCQRYYWRLTPGTSYGSYGTGAIISGTASQFGIVNPVPMRRDVLSVDYANLQVNNLISDASYAVTAVTLRNMASPNISTIETTSASLPGNGVPAWLRNANNTAGYLGFSAEL